MEAGAGEAERPIQQAAQMKKDLGFSLNTQVFQGVMRVNETASTLQMAPVGFHFRPQKRTQMT